MAKPLMSFREKCVKCAIWEGKTGPQITISRSFKDKNTNVWTDGKCFFPSDLSLLIPMLEQALKWCNDQAQENEARTHPPQNVPTTDDKLDF